MTETRFLSFGRLQYVFSRKVTRVLTVTALALAFNGVSAYAEPVEQAVQRQGKKVTGTVFDRTDNEPIVGATVQVVGTNIGTSTDIDGKFIISNLPAGAKKIRISFVGMKSQELDIKSEMTVYLDQDAQDMEEVLVVAYGTAKKGTFTGAASSVNSTQLSNKVMTTATSALVGSVPGLTVTTANGQPGSAPSIYIRGMGSMSASNDPLIVLDGMPYDNSISSINPSDIDNITILKDASSTALYGARAANGVLMITTKKGNKDKLRVNVSLNQGFTARQTGDYEKVNLNDYVKVYWENLRNQYVRDGSSYEDAGMAASKNLFDNLAYNPFNMPGEQALDANGNLNPMARLLWEDDTDWEDAVQQLGNRTDATVSISGGTDRADFFASVGYTDEKGYIIGSRFKRYTARSNMNAQITKWLKVGTNLSGNISLSDGNQNESSGNNSNPFRFVRNIGPIYPIHVHNPETGEYILDEAGNKIYDFGTAYSGNGIEVPARDFVSGNNPVKELQDRQDSFKRNTLNAKVYAEIKFLKGFTFTINSGVGANTYLSTSAAIVYPEKGNTGSVTKGSSRTTTWTHNQLLAYTNTFGQHTFDVLVGHESYSKEYNYLSASMKDEKFPGNYELANYSNINTTPTSYTNKYATEGYLSRLNYDFDSRYFASASFRRDASSRFYKKSRWGSFWSVGAGWRIDHEKFMSDIEWINMLKLRTAYGEVGNDDVGGYYPWRATYENAQNAGEAGFIQSSLGNRDLKWEVSRSFDVAVEFALFNRLRGSIEFFNRYSDNLLFSVPLSYSTGHTNQDMNTGTMYNRGVEIELSGDILTTPDFTWDATVNATHYKNKVTKLPVDPYTSGVHKIEEGHSRYDFYLRQWRGVDPATGSSLYVVDPQYLESSESLVEVGGVTYTTDHQEALYDYCGNSIPKLSGGLTTNLKYRDFSLTMSFYFQVGGKMYDSGYAGLMSPGTSSLSYSTVHKDIMNRWQKPGDITDVPRISNGSDASSLYASSDRFLISSDMLELSNINFGYSIPKHINKVLGISSLRFYVSAENVFQITRRKGIYPRKTVGGYSSNMDVYLPARVFTVGMNLNF